MVVCEKLLVLYHYQVTAIEVCTAEILYLQPRAGDKVPDDIFSREEPDFIFNPSFCIG
jgi:hypothetical protein